MCNTTIDKNIEILQDWKDGKNIEIKPKDDDRWDLLVYPNFDFTHYDYRIQPEHQTLSKSWVDFYEKNKDNIEWYYTFPSLVRNDKYSDKIRTLAKLLLLRDEYRQGWKPDWTNKQPKYVIAVETNKIGLWFTINVNSVLSFQSEEIGALFYENFKEMIEEVKDLI